MWFDESVFYQIYPLGFCDVLVGNDGQHASPVGEHARIKKVVDWIPHIKKLGADAIYFSPVFESDYHGYDTRDYTKIDNRLGSNEDFANVVRTLHENGIKVVIDGVFNHVGRGFFAFALSCSEKASSPFSLYIFSASSENITASPSKAILITSISFSSYTAGQIRPAAMPALTASCTSSSLAERNRSVSKASR